MGLIVLMNDITQRAVSRRLASPGAARILFNERLFISLQHAHLNSGGSGFFLKNISFLNVLVMDLGLFLRRTNSAGVLLRKERRRKSAAGV
jgi:hypothetical protein